MHGTRSSFLILTATKSSTSFTILSIWYVKGQIKVVNVKRFYFLLPHKHSQE